MGRTVLVVDDAPELRLLLQAVLKKAGHRVLLADSGAAALHELDAERPDLIVVDFMMPDMDGAELVRAIRTRAKLRAVPVLMLTASQDENHIEAAFAAGASDYMTKPIERRILSARVEALIRAAEDHVRVDLLDRVDEERQKLLEELREAERVQQARLPTVPVEVAGWAVAGALVPGRHIGGDFFDLMNGADGRPVLALVDISGHGLAAALLASALATELRTLARGQPLVEVMRRFNRQLFTEGNDRYACVGLIALGDASATVINAGLPPICLVHDGVRRATVVGGGTPPGLVPDADYEVCEVRLEPGDRLVAMSDGVTEPFGSCDEVEASLDRLGLKRAELEVVRLLPNVLGAQIRSLLGTERESDDATVVVAEWRGRPHARGSV